MLTNLRFNKLQKSYLFVIFYGKKLLSLYILFWKTNNEELIYDFSTVFVKTSCVLNDLEV